MSLLETLVELADLGVDLRGYSEKDLLYHAKQTNPFSVSTGTEEGRAYATTRKSTEEWTDAKGVTHPAVDRSASYVYGETEGHAAAKLLLEQMKKYNHSQHTLGWKYSAHNKFSQE